VLARQLELLGERGGLSWQEWVADPVLLQIPGGIVMNLFLKKAVGV